MNSKHDIELSDSLAKTISDSDLADLGKDLGEISIDSLLGDGVLKDLPIVGSLNALWKTGVSVKDALFVSRLQKFLLVLSEISTEDRVKIIEDLDCGEASEKVGEKILGLLERMDSSSKAILMGLAFQHYVAGAISKEILWRIAYIIVQLSVSDLLALESWESENLNKVEHIRKHQYLNVGLGWFVLDTSSTGFQWQRDLCSAFSKYLLPRFKLYN